jgi:hypothetical protein
MTVLMVLFQLIFDIASAIKRRHKDYRVHFKKRSTLANTIKLFFLFNRLFFNLLPSLIFVAKWSSYFWRFSSYIIIEIN